MITLMVDDQALRRRLAGLAARSTRLAPVLDRVGRLMVARTDIRFRAARDPEGRPWRPSRRARRTGGLTLVHTGRLRRSIRHRVIGAGTAVRVGSTAVYAAVHQFGTATVPARPFLGVGAADRPAIAAVVAAALAEAAS